MAFLPHLRRRQNPVPQEQSIHILRCSPLITAPKRLNDESKSSAFSTKFSNESTKISENGERPFVN